MVFQVSLWAYERHPEFWHAGVRGASCFRPLGGFPRAGRRVSRRAEGRRAASLITEGAAGNLTVIDYYRKTGLHILDCSDRHATDPEGSNSGFICLHTSAGPSPLRCIWLI